MTFHVEFNTPAITSNNPRTFRLAVSKDNVRSMKDANGIVRHFANLSVMQLAEIRFPEDINPRSHKVINKKSQRIEKGIRETLSDNSDWFQYINQGLTVVAKTAIYNEPKGTLDITLTDRSLHGLINGGTTDQILREYLRDNAPSDATVLIQVLSGDVPNDLIEDMAESLNTSVEVKQWSLYKSNYAYVQQAAEEKTSIYRDRVRYDEFQETGDIDLPEVLGLVCMFAPRHDTEFEPTVAYSSPSNLVRQWSSKGYREEIEQALSPDMIRQIFKLTEHVRRALPSHESLCNAVKQVKEEKQLAKVPRGILLPIVGALRILLTTKDGESEWTQDPFKFFDKHGEQLTARMAEYIRSHGWKDQPSTVGKRRDVWQSLSQHVEVLVWRAKAKAA